MLHSAEISIWEESHLHQQSEASLKSSFSAFCIPSDFSWKVNIWYTAGNCSRTWNWGYTAPDSFLQIFTIHVHTSELHLTLHPKYSCGMEGKQKRDQIISVTLSGTVYLSFYLYVSLMASTQKGLSTDCSDIAISICIATTLNNQE